MKKHSYILVLMLLLLVAPALLQAATFWDGVQVPLGQFVGVILMLFGVPVLVKLSKKWGIEITDSQAQYAIDALINIVVNVKLQSPDTPPAQKKKMATLTARNTLPNATIQLLEKKFGSLEAAVEKAYQESSLNKKGAK